MKSKTNDEMQAILDKLDHSQLEKDYPGYPDTDRALIGLRDAGVTELKRKLTTAELEDLQDFLGEGYKVHWPTLSRAKKAKKGIPNPQAKKSESKGQTAHAIISGQLVSIGEGIKALKDAKFSPVVLEGCCMAEDPDGELGLKKLLEFFGLLGDKEEEENTP